MALQDCLNFTLRYSITLPLYLIRLLFFYLWHSKENPNLPFIRIYWCISLWIHNSFGSLCALKWHISFHQPFPNIIHHLNLLNSKIIIWYQTKPYFLNIYLFQLLVVQLCHQLFHSLQFIYFHQSKLFQIQTIYDQNNKESYQILSNLFSIDIRFFFLHIFLPQLYY